MDRNYNIEITSKEGSPLIADNVLRKFDCSISDPSKWVTPGTTLEKGLTFLDTKGQDLNSLLFKNQAFFSAPVSIKHTEAESIEAFIYLMLFEHYNFERADITVKVIASAKNK